MTQESKPYRVILPDGRKTVPVDAATIRQLLIEKKIPPDAVVEQRIPIGQFVSPDPPATEKQKVFATELGISFDPMISRRAISKLIGAASDTKDEARFDQMERISAGDQSARMLLITTMEQEGHIWLCNASIEQMVNELESRDIAAVLITMKPEDVSTLVAVQEEEMTEDLVKEMGDVTSQLQFSDHIEKHEVKSVLTSLLLWIPEEQKPRRNRRLHD